uniref:Sec1 family domain-containing protein 1 n=1 Tax=Attheya septentrionalis TaxID=420275 RepID=A0A6T7FDC0_9STRA|mmetsp:Transcript_11523/g.20987  ORF Transcript_11523/g.20987 Transcript_11523/m.20987 type:complete len:703 (+) Transcript_11523:169-2277(+)
MSVMPMPSAPGSGGAALSPSSSSLKGAQLAAVSRMLALNSDADSGGASAADDSYNISSGTASTAGSSAIVQQWKILIYDTACRSIISPLLSVSQLRNRGVTLHLLLHSEREPIPDVPAVYFVEPTRENLARIAQDCAKGLYARSHLNFVRKLDRGLMEEFARLVVQSPPSPRPALQSIASVHDQYLDYVCLERNLFSLNKKDSYVTYNSHNVTEQGIEDAMNQIAYGLFSVVASQGQVPVIRCPRGGAPEMVARKLNRMIAEHPTLIRGKGLTGTTLQSHHRPLLVILDRNADLITPIQHASTYQALIDDVLDHSANRVIFTVKPTPDGGRSAKAVKKRYDLDADDDPFYSRHKFNPFPEAIESNGAELQDVTTRESEIRSKTTDGGKAAAAVAVVVAPEGSSATELATAVDSLPALLERKKQLEVHTSILQAVMNEVATRDVPQFYELESALSTGSYRNDLAKAKSEVLGLVTDASKGNVHDKIRLLMVYALATAAKTADVDEVASSIRSSLESTAGSSGVDKETQAKLDMGLNALGYVKKLRSMQMIPTMTASEDFTTYESKGRGGGGGGDMLSSFMARASTQASGLLAKATDKVGTMLGKIHKQHATKVVENLCEFKPASEDEEFLYLDPKVKGDVDVVALRNMNRSPIRQVICFMIGGGCYGEYQNLQMAATDRRSISYGSTELVNPSVFLSQLGKLS